MKLTPTQQIVLDKLSTTEWKCAYDIKCSLGTLNALINKKLVKSRHGAGAFSSPRTGIEFKKLKGR